MHTLYRAIARFRAMLRPSATALVLHWGQAPEGVASAIQPAQATSLCPTYKASGPESTGDLATDPHPPTPAHKWATGAFGNFTYFITPWICFNQGRLDQIGLAGSCGLTSRANCYSSPILSHPDTSFKPALKSASHHKGVSPFYAGV